MMSKSDDTDNQEVLNHLSSQYKIYRDEVRGYLQLAGGSVSLLIILLFGEMTAAKDNSLFLMLIPLSVLSYFALFCVMFIYASIAASYSELLELKMNALLGTRNSVYIFESEYVGPKPHQNEFLYFGLIWLLMPAMPLSLCVYALLQLGKTHRLLACLLAFAVAIGLVVAVLSTVKIMIKRKQKNDLLIESWNLKIGGEVEKNATGLSAE